MSEALLAAARATEPNVLLFDIETTPAMSWHWNYYQENINPAQVIKESTVLCYAAKWFGDATTAFGRKHGRSDKAVCKELWGLLDRADAVVAHNARRFDVKVLNARFIKHGLPPPSPYKTIDTLVIAKAVGKFGINKLDYLSRYMGSKGKFEHEGFNLWLRCMKNDPEAWDIMERYNIQDVEELEIVYRTLRPWDKKHPNIGIMHGDTGVARCVCCGSTNLEELTQASYTAAGVYPSFRCRDCGKPMRGRKADKRGDVKMANTL